MELSLRLPRVEVLWGDYNLTFYSGPDVKKDDPLYGEPLVYGVTVNLSRTGQNPSGEMTLVPTGQAYRIYEMLIKKFYDRIITVRYYYLDGRSITFAFVWSGQEESYGNKMEIKINLSSELDGLVNATVRSTAQVDPSAGEAGFSVLTTLKEIEKSFGVEKYNLIDFEPTARRDLEKAKVSRNYNSDMKFNASIEGVVQANGNTVFASNIVSAGGNGKPAIKCIIFPPYSWDKTVPVQELSLTEQTPDPKVRYGYFLGPCLIDTITKQSQWQPPQKRNEITSNPTQSYEPVPLPSQQVGPNGITPSTTAGASQQASALRPGAGGVHQGAARPRLSMKENEDGQKKIILLEKESQCKLSATLFMCPAITGIKPYDIIFIPNYSGTFMEDWIVDSITYSQLEGGVGISIQASRQFALGDFMNPTQGKIWLEKAKKLKIAGENPSLESWMAYAWKTNVPPASSTTPAPPPPSPPSPAPIPIPVIPYPGK